MYIYININIHRYTDDYILDFTKPESLVEAPFVLHAPIKLLIHGYTGHKDYSPNTELRPGTCNPKTIIYYHLFLHRQSEFYVSPCISSVAYLYNEVREKNPQYKNEFIVILCTNINKYQ